MSIPRDPALWPFSPAVSQLSSLVSLLAARNLKVELRRTISALSGTESESESVSQTRRRSRSSRNRLRSSVTGDLEKLEKQKKEQLKLVTEEKAETGKVRPANSAQIK